jgi:type I restriction enzyme S subunit
VKEVALGSVCEINPAAPRGLDPTAPCTFVPMEAVDDYLGAIVSPSVRTIAEVAAGSYTYFADGDVLFAKITPCMENGKCALAHRLAGGIGYGSTEFHVLRAGKTILPKWIYYLLRQENTRKQAERTMTGSAGQRRVPARFLEDVLVPLLPLPEQQRITAILERADRLRRMRRYALELSGGYLQAVFVEMFGDSESNPRGWKKARLSDIALINPAHPIGAARLSPTEPVSFIPMAAVDEHQSVVTARETKPYSEVAQGYTRFAEGDILFAKITPCMENGKIAIASGLRTGLGFGSTEFHVLRATSRFNRHWLLWFVRRDRFRDLARRSFTGTAGQQRVPAAFLEDYMVPVPPVPLQERFASVAQRMQRLRAQQREALRQAECLFQSLLHRAFRGEL